MSVHTHIRAVALGTTAIAVALAGAALAQPIEQVVITGSHIRGVAPVGSAVISVGAEDLAKTGATQTSDLLQKVPQFVGLGSNEQNSTGGSRVQGAAGNTQFARSLNLRGIGQTGTLTLFNGQRFAKNSLNDGSDVDMFPNSLVERIEVVADGASAIYGSDAVAGTVNVILKEPHDVIETSVQGAIKNGSFDYQFTQTLGTTWDNAASALGDGGLLLAYSHSYIDAIDAADRPDLYNDDLSPYIGAAGLPPTFASPGNVRGLTGGGGTATSLYASPSGIGGTQALNLSQLGAAGQPRRQSIWLDAYPLPKISRDTLGGIFKQDLTDWLKFSAFGTYVKRSGSATYGTRPVTNSTISVPATNPYSPCRTGGPADTTHTPALTCPANGTITVVYAWTQEFGGSALREFSSAEYNFSGVFDISLPYEWHAKVTGTHGRNQGAAYVTPEVITTRLAQVVTGTGKPANVPFFNPFCDNSAAPCNNPITVNYVKSYTQNANYNWVADAGIGFDGPLFDLPGGTVRLAFGGEWYRVGFRINNGNINNAGAIYLPTTATLAHDTVHSAYGELYVPIIGDSNAMPGVQKLELTLAGRFTDYESSTTSQDPKIGINWTPVLGLKLHGSWGTSFRAPNLRENAGGGSNIFVVNTITCGQYVGINLAACTTGNTTPLSLLSSTGGNYGLTPETATTWTLGADWTPDSIPGLYASLTYYNLDNRDRITQATRDAGDIAVVNAGHYDQFIRFNPAYFPTRAVNNQPYRLFDGTSVPTGPTQAAYDAFLATYRAEYPNMTVPTSNPVAFIYDGRFINSGVLTTDGLDFQARYDWDMDWGSMHVGAGGNYTLSFKDTPVAAAPPVEQVNKFANNQQFRVRFEAGAEFNGFNVTGYVNHTGSYEVDPNYLPIGAGAQYQEVDSFTTFDLSVGYTIGEDVSVKLLRNTQLALIASNLFDTQPPFMLNGASSTPILFDPNAHSPVGRVITMRVTKNW